jgi:hypothetical protein
VPIGAFAAAAIAAAIGLLLLALFHPISHDEDQYLAATALVSRGFLPYRDFAYLQTPLQPFIFAPLAWLFRGWLLVASRVVSALLAFLTITFVYVASRRLGASHKAAVLGALLLCCCYPFLWAAGVARNDMLPAALLAAGLCIGPTAGGPGRLVLAGLCFGFAASAKISYVLPAAAIAAALLVPFKREPLARASWLLAGELLGIAPTALFAFVTPQPFFFDVIIFAVRAPLIWYRDIGSSGRLGAGRFLDILEASVWGRR